MVKSVTAGGTQAGRLTPAAGEAWGAMRALMISGEGFDQLNQACDALGISVSVAKSLFHIIPDEPEPMRVLAERWRCDASYITAIVDDLEELGLAQRQAHPRDRRIKTVALTAKGVELRASLMVFLSVAPPAFGALTAAEQRQLRDLLAKVTAAAEPR
jgi:DNA-binding MarR family transcriptional regulator